MDLLETIPRELEELDEFVFTSSMDLLNGPGIWRIRRIIHTCTPTSLFLRHRPQRVSRSPEPKGSSSSLQIQDRSMCGCQPYRNVCLRVISTLRDLIRFLLLSSVSILLVLFFFFKDFIVYCIIHCFLCLIRKSSRILLFGQELMKLPGM